MAVTTGYPAAAKQESSGAYWAYQILHFGFAVLPIVTGIDKFFDYLGKWDQYLSPSVTRYVNGELFMRGVGIVEIVAGILVAFWPRVGAYIVALWLLGIIANIITLGLYYDVALRDFGLFLGAIALGQLAQYFRKRPANA